MQQINRLRRVAMSLALLVPGVVGCGRDPDERLAEFAQRSLVEQRRQNDRMADQSRAVVEESHQLATGSAQTPERRS